jgi:hypothetical protein
MNGSGRLVLGGGIGLLLGGVIAVQRQSPAQKEQPTTTSRPQGANIRKRLTDPALRLEFRAEALEQVRSEHPDIAEVLGLDPGLEARLFEVLTDRAMAEVERFQFESPRLRMLASQNGGDPDNELQHEADAETRAKVQIRDVLGVERFELYLGYMDSVIERRAVQYFERHLEQRDLLTADQRERLIALLRLEDEKRAARDRAESRMESHSISSDFSEGSMHRRDVGWSEDIYRHMLEDSRALLTRLPAILTPRQLDAFTQMEASKLARQKASVRAIRAKAGLNPEFDETQPRQRAKRRLVAGKVRLELTVTVEPHLPVTKEVITENGSTPAPFEFPEGLWIEATPTLDEEGWAQVDYAYLEERGGKRFRLRDSSGEGFRARTPDGVPNLVGGSSSGTVRCGWKTFVVKTRVRITPVE